ncbi:hypothetical protein BJ138DRAFT_1119261 [Hygrophoropsis aurantiaca]|uniref:Uncharacterized protein n=1 Tax=Hygrophoropsis aurantiaca TaxID=72124 RepID=A0ACB7ZUR2_9AGAM|nr:hypothetical protein BJ138DRAFT_1119261 [Hygrophoropsis aurantiaca]
MKISSEPVITPQPDSNPKAHPRTNSEGHGGNILAKSSPPPLSMDQPPSMKGEFDRPKDLNLIVPHGQFSGMHRWLLRSGYEELPNHDVHEDMATHLHNFQTFGGHNEVVTLSEAKGPDVLDIVVNAPSTADMTFATAGGVVTLYPELTMSWRGVVAPLGRWELMLGGRFGCINTGRFHLHDNMSFTKAPCGTSCPSIWRLPRTDKRILVIDWDKRYSVQPIVHQCKTEWRLSRTCANDLCQSSGYARRDGPTFREELMPDTAFDVQDRLADIDIQQPALKKGYRGLLYATLCAEPIIVEVPLIEGATELKSIEDLYIECWVRQRGHTAYSARRAKLRRTYYSVPNLDTVPLDYAYTVFTEDGLSDPPINALLNKMAPPSPKSPYLQGNFLVIKQDTKAKMALVDVCDKDIFVVNLILRRQVHVSQPTALTDGDTVLLYTMPCHQRTNENLYNT